MKDAIYLSEQLKRLDGKNYKAYKDIEGTYYFNDFDLIIDHVQGDPFAAPSRVRVKIPQKIAGFPSFTYLTRSREIALRDFLTRRFKESARQYSTSMGTGAGGQIEMLAVGQQLLERSSILINHETVEARFSVGLPANGRRILGLKASEILIRFINKIVKESLIYQSLDAEAIRHQVLQAEDADWIRRKLREFSLVAFIADGSVLPRKSGIDDRPLDKGAVKFDSPASLRVTFDCPNQGKVTGMGIPRGITLVVGGGYHGKSTLLDAISNGVYNHIHGDGREWVITDATGTKIRAEDGRSITNVNISPFINNLPLNKSTTKFSTQNASGSTSQATNIVEALEAGSRLLLIDEDTSATNFMIRDHRMQLLIKKEKEPITPFVDRVRPLYEEYQVSTLMVMGGSGDYFESADTVIGMDNFKPADLTSRVKEIIRDNPNSRGEEGHNSFGELTKRYPAMDTINPRKGNRTRVRAKGNKLIQFGNEQIDVSMVEQIVEPGQLKAISEAILLLSRQARNQKFAMTELLRLITDQVELEGIHAISGGTNGTLSYFRAVELAAALNRIRGLKVD